MDKKQIIEVVKKRKTPIIIVTLALLAVIAFAFLFIWAEMYGYHSEITIDVSMVYCPRITDYSRESQQTGRAGSWAINQHGLSVL